MDRLVKNVLVRREFFGATLLDVTTGHRVYINNDEFVELKNRDCLSDTTEREIGTAGKKYALIEPDYLPKFNFSAPDTVFFEITRACNARCLHCFNNSGIRLAGELSCEEKKEIIKDLRQNGVQEIRFTGGEPLVSQELFELLSFSSRLGLRNSIGTNATLITKDCSKYLADNGLHFAVVSVDGAEIVHDKIRGQGSFTKAMQGIYFLKSQGIPIRINTVVMRSNAAEIVPLVEFFFKQKIPLFLRRFIPIGRLNNSNDEMLTDDEYNNLKKSLKPYIEDGSNLVQGHYLYEQKPKTRINLPFKRQRCSVGNRGLVILPNGKVQTCGFLGSIGEQYIGCVPTESLKNIWKRLLESSHVQSLCNSLAEYNAQTNGPRTNCFAIAIATKNKNILRGGF